MVSMLARDQSICPATPSTSKTAWCRAVITPRLTHSVNRRCAVRQCTGNEPGTLRQEQPDSSTALTGRQTSVVLLVLVWAVRLTANWASSWRGLRHEDWRYVQLREERPRLVPWWLVNLTGIQLMPTLVVFAGLLPVWPAVTETGRP